MSRLNSKLVLKALSGGSGSTQTFEVAKSVNTLAHGVPGDILTRAEVDTILKSADNRGQRNTLTVEFVK